MQVFRGSDAVRRGLLTRHQLRGRAWIRLRHDVHVLVPPSSRIESQPGLRVHRGRLVTGEVVRTGGLLVTAPARTAWDLAVWLDVVAAVAVIDGLLGRRLVSVAELGRLASARAGRRGARRAARAFGLADGRAQSRPESELRVRLVLAGLPRPVPQYPVRLANGLILHPDLAWPEYRVAVEYDGVWHADADQLHRDRRRLNQLVGAGWIVLHVTSRRLYRDIAGVVDEVRAALRSR